MRKTIAISVAMCCLFAESLWAHHAFSMFDQTQRVELHGVVKEFQWTNPHVWVQLLVTDDDGTVVEWSIEGSSPNGLRRQGWKSSTLQPGMDVTVIINPLKDGQAGGSLVNVTLPDGTVMGRRLDPND